MKDEFTFSKMEGWVLGKGEDVSGLLAVAGSGGAEARCRASNWPKAQERGREGQLGPLAGQLDSGFTKKEVPKTVLPHV